MGYRDPSVAPLVACGCEIRGARVRIWPRLADATLAYSLQGCPQWASGTMCILFLP